MFKLDSKHMKRRFLLGEIVKYDEKTELLTLNIGKGGDINLHCHISKLYNIDRKKTVGIYYKPPEATDHPLNQGDVLNMYPENLELTTYRRLMVKISDALGAEGY